MPALVAGIHVFLAARKQDVDGRDIGERSDAVLRTAMPGHDESCGLNKTIYTTRSFNPVMPALVAGIHVLFAARKQDVDGRDIGERSDAVLRTAMPGHDESCGLNKTIYTTRSFNPVMPALVAGIHVFLAARKQDVDGRDIGERSDAVLRTAMPGHDESCGLNKTIYTTRSFNPVMPALVAGIHVFLAARKQDVDGRDIGERSDAVLRTAMPGHDE